MTVVVISTLLIGPLATMTFERVMVSESPDHSSRLLITAPALFDQNYGFYVQRHDGMFLTSSEKFYRSPG